MNRYDVAVSLKDSGKCNCAQAVLIAYKDLLNLSEEDLLKLGSGFGVGMGCLEATCGALIGANMILGLLNDGNKKLMFKSKELLNDFKNMSHDTICKSLKAIVDGKPVCECNMCVKNACLALDKLI